MFNDHTTAAENQRFIMFQDSLRTRGRKDQTLESYQSAHRTLAKFYHHHNQTTFDLQQVSGLDLRHFKSQSLDAGGSPRTINHRIVFLRLYASWAEKAGQISRIQAESICAVPLLPLVPLGARVPSADELRRFLRHVELTAGPRDQAIVALLLNGLRESEVAGLKLSDIEIRSNRGSVRLHGNHIKGSATRTVPLTRQARITLQTYLGDRDKDGLVFVGERGPLTVSGLYKLIKRLSADVGLDLHPHTFRRVFAKEYYARNPDDLNGLKLLMGHAQLETLLRSYLGRDAGDLERGIDKLEI